MAGSGSGLPGSTVSVAITMSNIMPLRGFTLGISHLGSVATLTGIAQGPVCMVTNGGAGADFVHTDLNPVNGPGGILGIIVSLSPPIEELPAGTGQHIASFAYNVVGAPGASTPLTFSNTLGNPDVPTVFSVAGVSFTPTQSSGQLSVLTPPVEALTCSQIDPCDCTYLISWSNPVTYQSIDVALNGATVATTTGNSVMVTVPEGVASSICVVGTAGGVASASTCCNLTCVTQPVGQSVQNLSCGITAGTCDALLTWTNPEVYSGLSVLLDGAPVATLPGTATQATITLPGLDSYQLCVVPTDGCGNSVPPACCDAQCERPFVRSDANADASIDISDAIIILGFLFNSKPVSCLRALDANDDNSVNVADSVFTLGYQFTMGANPPAPFPACGSDLTPDVLGCDSYPLCAP